MSPPTSGPWWLVVAMALEAPLIATQNRCMRHAKPKKPAREPASVSLWL